MSIRDRHRFPSGQQLSHSLCPWDALLCLCKQVVHHQQRKWMLDAWRMARVVTVFGYSDSCRCLSFNSNSSRTPFPLNKSHLLLWTLNTEEQCCLSLAGLHCNAFCYYDRSVLFRSLFFLFFLCHGEADLFARSIVDVRASRPVLSDC